MENKLLSAIKSFLKNKKTTYFKILDIKGIAYFADYFVIVSLDNNRAVEAITSELIDYLSKNGFELRNKEGMRSPWILLDYNDVIVHIFDDETRKFYDIEKIWADAKEVD